MILGSRARTAIKTSDGAVKAGPGQVYWVAVSAGATAGAFQLVDGLTDTSNDLFDITMTADTYAFFGPFDPPLQFDIGIFADIPGTNLSVNVGYN